MPGTEGCWKARPLPAHSSVLITVRDSTLPRSARLSVNGFSTSPVTLRRHSAASTVLGSCMWLRTKKCGTGVIHEFRNSIGISTSRKRKERKIIPSLPGIVGTSYWVAAQLSTGWAAPAAASKKEASLRSSRREIIRDLPLDINTAVYLALYSLAVNSLWPTGCGCLTTPLGALALSGQQRLHMTPSGWAAAS